MLMAPIEDTLYPSRGMSDLGRLRPDTARGRCPVADLGCAAPKPTKGERMLLILAIVLLIIAIAGGVIVHPLLFALAIVALVLFFMGR
jgi:hypothetical protein